MAWRLLDLVGLEGDADSLDFVDLAGSAALQVWWIWPGIAKCCICRICADLLYMAVAWNPQRPPIVPVDLVLP